MILKTSINIENIRCQVDAAHHLQSAGEDETARSVLIKMSQSILKELNYKK